MKKKRKHNFFRIFQKLFRFFFKLGFLAAVISVIAVLYSDWRISTKTAEFIYSDCDSIPHNKVGLLLGTSEKVRGGRTNLYFQYRIDAVTELFFSGKIDYILVSGDNSTVYYNEPVMMKKALIKKGIPYDRIYLDYAGFRTYDSMVRAERIFGQLSFTVISQEFHVQRAVFIGRRLKQEVVGFVAADVSRHYGFKTRMREKFARVKVFMDFIFRVKPRFLGESIEIPDI